MKKAFPLVFIGFLLVSMLEPSVVRADRTIVRMETNFGDIIIELYDSETPITVENFMGYVNRGFYDGVIFHRVIDDFMIQAGVYDEDIYTYIAGDPDFDDPDWLKDPLFYHDPNDPIKDEIVSTLHNDRGTISMANSGPNTGASQFFINQKTSGNRNLDGKHAVFGEVLEGMDVVDEIAGVETFTVGEDSAYPMADVPVEGDKAVILSVTELRKFDPNSSDLSDVPFLHASDGLRRMFAGQGDCTGANYTHVFSEVKFLGISCLKWEQKALSEDDSDIDSFYMYLAKDTSGALWVLKYYLNGYTEFQANSLLEATAFTEYDDNDMYFRLITGSYDPDNLADPDNTLVIGVGSTMETTTIESISASLDNRPEFDSELIRVKWSQGEDETDVNWHYYHESVGLVLDLRDDTGDVEEDGWQLAAFNFDATSGDLSDVPYLHGEGGLTRTYMGQGDYEGKSFTHTFYSIDFLGIKCLKWYQSRQASAGIDSFYFHLAKDTEGDLWVLKYYTNGTVEFEADSLLDARPFSEYSGYNMAFRLIAGGYDPDDLDDPSNELVIGEGDSIEKQQITSFSESLEDMPYYEDDLVQVKHLLGPEEDETRWSYFDESVGLVMCRLKSVVSSEIGDTSGWRLAWFGKTEPQFDENSNDFSKVPFMMARPGDMRIYRGQGELAGNWYKTEFPSKKLLGVDCLKIEKRDRYGFGVESSIYGGRDSGGQLWVFREDRGEVTLFEAEDISRIVPFEKYLDMHLWLMSGEYDEGMTLTGNVDDGTETQEIISLTESLDGWSDYNDELVLVKSTQESDAGEAADWGYYHESVGPVLWLEENAFEPSQIDFDGYGWYLDEPSDLTNVKIVLKASKNRDQASDKFVVSGELVAEDGDFAGGILFLHVGTYSAQIEISEFVVKQSGGNNVLIYSGSPNETEMVAIKINLAKGTFLISGKRLDLSGMGKPIKVDIVTNSYWGCGQAQIKNNKEVPIVFMQGYEDVLREEKFTFVYDDRVRNDSLTVKGEIATREYPIDLSETKVTVSWGSNTFIIKSGELVKKNANSEKYTYQASSGNLGLAYFDMENGTFRIVIRKAYLLKPTQDLGVKIEDEDGNVLFNEKMKI